MFETRDNIIVHPADEIAMDDMTVECFPSSDEAKAIFTSHFLGPAAESPLLFIWRPEAKILGLYFALPL